MVLRKLENGELIQIQLSHDEDGEAIRNCLWRRLLYQKRKPRRTRSLRMGRTCC